MPRTVSQTINLQAVPEAVSKYITRIDGGGISIHDTQRQNLDYLQLTSNGIDIKQNNISIASFGANGARIGQNQKSHIEIDATSLKLKDLYNRPYVIFQDMWDETIEGTLVTEKFEGDGAISTFTLSLEPKHEASSQDGTSSIVSLYVDNQKIESGYSVLVSEQVGELYISDTPAAGSEIRVSYISTDSNTKYYTLGTRAEDNLCGVLSLASGLDVIASGHYSHAEGYKTIASGFTSHSEGNCTIANGYASHAEGTSTEAAGYSSHAEGYETAATRSYSHAQNLGTIAAKRCQTAIGRYNIEDISAPSFQKALIIGNGIADDTRSNALTVDWQGRIECGDYSGTLTSIFDIFYPVGSYYDTSDSSFDPNTSLGGTWSSEVIVDDEIVEQGTNSIWTYRKWKSGIAECWGRRDVTISLNNNYGGAYYATDEVSFPTGLFSAEPTVSASRQGRAGAGLIHISPYSVSSTKIEYFVANTNGVYNSAPIGIAINARGLWKTYSAPTTKYRWHRTA